MLLHLQGTDVQPNGFTTRPDATTDGHVDFESVQL